MFNKLTTCRLLVAGAALWIVGAVGANAAEPAATNPDTSRSPPTGAQPASPDGWGSLSGRFVYAGPSTDARLFGERLPASGDALVVDPSTGGIKNIVIYARKVSRVHPSYYQGAVGPDQNVVLEIEERAYTPRVLAMERYQSLTIRNRDPVPHVFLMRSPAELETNVLLGPGEEIVHRFLRQHHRPLVAKCGFHPWMVAHVLVRDDPYFALSDEYGWFVLHNLPANEEIELQVWHELGRGPDGALEARPEWVAGRLRVTIPQNGAADLGTIEVGPAAFRAEQHLDAGRAVHDGALR